MALWKPFRGNRADLASVEKHDGYVYFCTDDGSLFFDYVNSEGELQRKQISVNTDFVNEMVAIKNVFEVSTAYGGSYLDAINEVVGETTLGINDLAIVNVSIEDSLNDQYFKIIYKYDGTMWNAITDIPQIEIASTDLFDINDARVGYEVYGDGRIISNARSAVTGYCFIPDNATTITITGLPPYSDNASRYYCFYDENKNVISGSIAYLYSSYSTGTISIPNGAKYFVISIYQRTSEYTNLTCATNLSITTDVEVGEAQIVAINNIPIKIEDSEEVDNAIKIYSISATSANLNTNTIYSHELSASDTTVEYTFATPSNTSIQNQILIYLKTNAATSVVWNGNVAFVGNSIANISIGAYRIIAEWNPAYVNSDGTKGAWIIGVIQDGAEGGIAS